MKRVLLSLLVLGSFFSTSRAQDIVPNGQIDNLLEFSTVYSEEFVMSDGVKLMTDVYLPVMRDCLMVPINIDLPSALGGGSIDYNLELIPRGTQYVIYDSINGQPNPNPYQLPIVLTRTPYNKGDQDAEEAPIMNLLGYAFLKQDQRGRYASEGVYLPLTSDGWRKHEYHPNFKHVLDAEEIDDPKCGNYHEDGYDTKEYIKNSLMRDFDLDGDGITDTTDLLYTGRFAMFGASALGYNQYQAAAAHMLDENEPGLKAIMPIVAPADFYKGVGYPNGVLRDRLVTGWLKGQIFDTDDDLIPIDNDMHNNIHSSADYNLPQSIEVNSVMKDFQQNKFDAANLAIDHFVSVQYPDDQGRMRCGYYPDFVGRAEIDISRARMDANGNPDPNGMVNRFTNMEVPGYHLCGWWDIFVDSQTESWANMRRHLSPNKFNRPGVTNRELQKLVLGPWAHQTIGSTTTGDRTYPDNVNDLLGINFDDFSETNIPIDKALNSEVIGWFRYNLNYHPDEFIGEPKFILPESDNLYPLVDLGLLGTVDIRVPAEEVKLPYTQLISVLTGVEPLSGLKADLILNSPFGQQSFTIDLPDIPLDNVIPGLNAEDIDPIPYRDFADPNEIPNVRLYVIGPNDDTEPQNVGLSNYWLGVDTFPLPEGRDWDVIQREVFYMHKNGTLDNNAPTTDEGFKMYVHDPDDPIRTIGGANMIVSTPDGERDSQGQFNLKDPRYEPHTMNRPGVVAFESAPVEDSLCIIGFPRVKLYAKSNIGGLSEGPTDTDFHVRIIDVYPDGREYFVQDGCVNARARDYVRMLVEEPWKDWKIPFEGDDIPFTNINIGEIYEYHFDLLPIAYTFGDGHKVKILVSSSNFTRYQVNPNVPIEDGEFFRRKPGDGKKYIFEGEEYAPRVAIQRIHFSPEHPTQISLPVYTRQYTGIDDPTAEEAGPELLVYPNPANDVVTVFMDNGGEYDIRILNLDGSLVRAEGAFRDHINLDVSELSKGIYFVELVDTESNQRFVEKLTKL
jgi:predicted acyl esterase